MKVLQITESWLGPWKRLALCMALISCNCQILTSVEACFILKSSTISERFRWFLLAIFFWPDLAVPPLNTVYSLPFLWLCIPLGWRLSRLTTQPCASLSSNSLVDETGLDEPIVNKMAVDEIVIDEPGTNHMALVEATGKLFFWQCRVCLDWHVRIFHCGMSLALCLSYTIQTEPTLH